MSRTRRPVSLLGLLIPLHLPSRLDFNYPMFGDGPSGRKWAHQECFQLRAALSSLTSPFAEIPRVGRRMLGPWFDIATCIQVCATVVRGYVPEAGWRQNTGLCVLALTFGIVHKWFSAKPRIYLLVTS